MSDILQNILSKLSLGAREELKKVLIEEVDSIQKAYGPKKPMTRAETFKKDVEAEGLSTALQAAVYVDKHCGERLTYIRLIMDYDRDCIGIGFSDGSVFSKEFNDE